MLYALGLIDLIYFHSLNVGPKLFIIKRLRGGDF